VEAAGVSERLIRPLRPQPRVIPSSPDLREPAATDPFGPQDEEGLASIAYLANLPPEERYIVPYLQSLNNAAYARTLQGANPQ